MTGSCKYWCVIRIVVEMRDLIWQTRSQFDIKQTSSTRVGSEFTPRIGIESSIKWLACKRVPSPPTVTTRSTLCIGFDKLLRKMGSQSTGFRLRISWQQFMASLWTLSLSSKCLKIYAISSEDWVRNLNQTSWFEWYDAHTHTHARTETHRVIKR